MSPRIISHRGKVDLSSLENDLAGIQEAIDLPRVFALDGLLKIEKSLDKLITKKLDNIGHNISVVPNAIGGGQCIKIDRNVGVLIGGSDPRKDGMAIGY